MMLGAYLLIATAASFAGNPLMAIAAALVLSLMVGVLVYVLLMRRMTGEMALALPGGARISIFAALLVASTALIYSGLFTFLRFGNWGIRMRAAGQNPL